MMKINKIVLLPILKSQQTGKMTMQKIDGNRLLFTRIGLVIFAVVSTIIATGIMITNSLDTFSYLAGIPLLVGASIIFGWACYIGVAQRQANQI